MEHADAAKGILGAGVISGDPQPEEWERKIAERAEEHYRERLIQRFFIAWAYLGNLGLLAFSLSCFVAFDGLAVWVLVAAVVVPVSSIVVSARFLYRQHFRVRAVEASLRELRRIHRERVLEEFTADDLLTAHKRYRTEIPEVVESFRRESRAHRRRYSVLQGVIIPGSIAASVLTATSVSIADTRWISVAMSLLVAIAAAFTGYAKFRERSVSLQQAADALEREYHCVDLRVGRYRRFADEREAYAEFAQEAETLREEQATRQQQLGQPAVSSSLLATRT